MAKELSTEDNLQYQFNPVTSGALHFKVRAANDAHIALTSGPCESDPMYEVFIGGWSNTKSVIRKNRTKPDVVEVPTEGILNNNEFRGFWIQWDNGTITAGKEGEAEPFLKFTDSEQVGIGYYGICSGWGASGTWLIEGGGELTTIDGGDCLSYNFYPVLHGAIDFQVRTPSNAHISLTTGPTETQPMYEILLGGWENTASVIRYNREKPDKVRVDTPGLLSQGESKNFLIEWHDGNVSVVHQGRTLIEWTDPQPIGVSHFGVRTAWGATGNWTIYPVEPTRSRRDTQNTVGWKIPSTPSSRNDKFLSAAQPGWNIPGNASGSACWVAAASGEVPPNAVPGGFDNEQLYVARAQHEGALLPGKLVPSHGVVYVPWGGAEHGKTEYEVLCGCQATWVKANDGQLPAGALPAGQSEGGEQLYVGRAEHEGTLTVGKVQVSHNVCYIPFGGAELAYPDYEVLVAN